MSLLCESSSESTYRDETTIQEFSMNIFSNILQHKDGLRLSTNKFVFKLYDHEDKVREGLTHWTCSHQKSDFSVCILIELRNIKKVLEKRLPDTLNKEFKFVRLTYQKPNMTLNFKFSMISKPNSIKLFQKQINQIISNINEIILRIKQFQKEHEKIQPYIDLYSMRECFQFNRTSRAKCSKISLKTKRNKNVSQVLKLLAETDMTLNKLQSVFIEGQIRKYEDQKSKIYSALQEMTKNKEKTFEQSILTSIQIKKVESQKVITFFNQNPQNLLSIISTATYTFRKQITIHKENELQSLSNQIFTSTLVKKQKSQKGSNQFENQTKLLTFLKGSFHPFIAEYYCKLQEWPFKSEALYVQYYTTSLGSIKHSLCSQKKLRIIYQLSKVLSFLNYRRICHRDLKLDNVMIDVEANAKIIDWGSACPMFSAQKDSGGGLKVKDQTLYSTEGYFQRYYEDIFHQTFGKNYSREQIQKGQFFDIYSFGFIIQKVFDLKNCEFNFWLDHQMQYLSYKCREKNPADRLSAIQLQIYLTLLRKKYKKFKEEGLSSPISSTN